MLTKPRKLSRVEIRQRFPLECTIDPKGAVAVPTAWRRANLRPLIVKPGLPAAWLHKDAVPVFARWLQRAGEWGLLDRIVTMDGGFVPRIMRGKDVPVSEAGLSLHSYGIALDINAKQNARGTRGVDLGMYGCVLELVPLAYEAGLVWGGDWRGASCDPMHFEVGQRPVIITPAVPVDPGKAR